MKKITILALRNTFALTVIGPMDVFFVAGRLWNYINGLPLTPFFEVEIASLDRKPVKCLNNFLIQPHLALDDVEKTDLILIPSLSDFDIEKTIKNNQKLVDWLRHLYLQGTAIAGICTGAFLLAETGLLDNKTATTHWGYVDLFRKLFPKVNLKPERLITDEGDLFCAGGLGAGIDLPVYLVEKFCGHEVAIQCSKTLIHSIDQNSQAAYTVFQYQKNHRDNKIKLIQKWIEDHYAEEIDFDQVATLFGMSRRSFERRFKKATGDTPLLYLQRTRIEVAKKMLESKSETFDEICYRTGYEDSSHFRKLFKKHTGLLPTEYQKKFNRLQ